MEESDLDSKEIRNCHHHTAGDTHAQLAPAGCCPLLQCALRAKEKQFPAALLPRCHGGVSSAPHAPQPRSDPAGAAVSGTALPAPILIRLFLDFPSFTFLPL